MKDIHAKVWATTRYPIDYGEIPESTITYEPYHIDPLALVPPSSITEGVLTTEEGIRRYPSITRILKATDKEGAIALAKWRARVGKVAAAGITAKAASAGTNWHAFAEKFLIKEPFGWKYFTEPRAAWQAATLAAVLNANFESVIASEIDVASHQLKLMGRLDVAGKLKDGRLAVLDFKTGARLKDGNRLAKAAIQCAFYAQALAEHLSFGDIGTVVVVQILPDAIYWQESDASYWNAYLRKSLVEYNKLGINTMERYDELRAE